MITISNRLQIAEQELEWQFIRASGAGGQHVNKVSTAAQLIFDIHESSLPDDYKTKLLALSDHRISPSGKIIIKCQQSRSQDDNRQQALAQFCELLLSVTRVQKRRIATKATRASQIRRVDSKKKRGAVKSMRQEKIRN
ncbi:aminoacyl-tRNA hydrolase [Shewanella yunxiaonensis]|uniref:Aminoacyl-tRNA hydrolase n=1 Tax=Shewanella yunxiaonensis TaxID=2829809 RepID=A0ABX7YSB9_9GAMM|nr:MULTISPECIES: alternative ribosome rescue aminoacyl-tRNA hydrolase ArfB [Shewanella]MDF0534195.1 alternative ribosome rescue aminoacyl-tRNA hydrolase ArfB [Shewanella sp. A32]QUN05534.1 aminoacyl-tRNA hydrolase [Shewanella yunxiaonensis]